MAKKRQPRTCRECGQVIKLARVQGRNNKLLTIAIDPEPHPVGSVAAYVTSSGGLLGRFLAKTDTPLGYERRYLQHTCPKPAAETAPPVPAPDPQPTLFDDITL